MMGYIRLYINFLLYMYCLFSWIKLGFKDAHTQINKNQCHKMGCYSFNITNDSLESCNVNGFYGGTDRCFYIA